MSAVGGWIVAIVLVSALLGAAVLFGADSRDGRDWKADPRDGPRS